MKNMRMTDSMQLLICFLVLTVCEVQGSDFISSPGNVSVLENRPLILSWTHAIPDQDIEWCYYQFRSPSTSPDEFLGWDNKEKKRLNISDNHIGWRFINQQYPCLGGIKRDHAESHHAGSYRFYVITAQGEEHVNQNSAVTVLTGSQLMYTLQISDEEMTGSVADQTVLETMEMERTDSNIMMSIRLGKDFASDITLRAHYRDSPKAESLQSCPMSISCSSEVPAKNDLIQLSAAIGSGIQGAEDVRVHQPVLIRDKSVITAGEKKCRTTLIVILVMISLIVIGGVVGLISFLKFRKRKSKKEESRRLLKTELESTKSELNMVQGEITDLRIQNTVLTEEKNTLEESNQVLSRNLEKSEEASKETKLKLNALDEDYHKLQNELEKKKSECAALSGTLYSAHDTKAEDDKIINELQNQILILESDLADKNNIITTRKKDYDELYVENETNKKHIGRLKEDLTVNQQSIEQLYETINSLKQEKQTIQNDDRKLTEKQKSKGKPSDTSRNPSISGYPMVHKNPTFEQLGSSDVMPDSVQQTGDFEQFDDHNSVDSADEATEIPPQDQCAGTKTGDQSGDVATTPQETPNASIEDEPTLCVVKKNDKIFVKKDNPILVSFLIEKNHRVKATWLHNESEAWKNEKFMPGIDGNMYYLLVYDTKKHAGGDYTCHLKAVGSTPVTCVTHVTIKDKMDLKFDMKLKDVSYKIGSPVSIKASVKHQDSVDFTWLKDGVPVPGDQSDGCSIGNAQDSKSVSTTLSIDHFSAGHAGKYHIFAQAGELQNCCTFQLMIK